ncbi:S10 family serine carboxypeptidase-like protein [Chromobacterium alticapitis]|uniref:Uncharacterized protein n=1 Tax=Chromobacterium alticapitis TaxID=2073169 RepID=A0A2S5DJV9_9NEIS|nr:hypothetical protein [Chromobacterium alticapitis]POZ63363.1 hypothetical protein C2I19_03125 [Chromobacterium alticapitis]
MNTVANPFQFESSVLSHFPGFGAVRTVQLAGYLSIGDDAGGWLYFWFSEAARDPENAPLVIWINHAQEQNALDCLFDGHGPYLLGEGGQVHANPFSWHQHANYLILDQPLGGGLSFAVHPRYLPECHAEASQQTYHALQEFLLRWPRYRQLDCYLFGLGEASHTIARLAHCILDGNHSGQPLIRLRGLGLGNALLAPEIQLQSHIEFASQNRLINTEEREKAETLLRDFRQALASPSPLRHQQAERLAEALESHVARCGGRDPRDIRQPPEREPSRLSGYLANPAVLQSLHIDPRSLDPAFANPSALSRWQSAPSHLYPPLLEKLQVLFFHGEYGMSGNHLGLDAWLNTIYWKHAAAFRQQGREAWRPYGLPAGAYRRQGGLSHLVLHNAGLHIARAQPANALAMLRQFLHAPDQDEGTV